MSFLAEREKAKKTQLEVARHMNVTPGAVSQWETGYSAPKMERLIKLAEFYGCTVDDLLKEDRA